MTGYFCYYLLQSVQLFSQLRFRKMLQRGSKWQVESLSKLQSARFRIPHICQHILEEFEIRLKRVEKHSIYIEQNSFYHRQESIHRFSKSLTAVEQKPFFRYFDSN